MRMGRKAKETGKASTKKRKRQRAVKQLGTKLKIAVLGAAVAVDRCAFCGWLFTQEKAAFSSLESTVETPCR